MAHKRYFRWPRLGWLFLLGTIVIGCALLVTNGVLVSFLLGQTLPVLPQFWRNPRVVQGILFMGPVLLLVIEWWAYDVIIDWILPIRRDTVAATPSEQGAAAPR